MTSVEVGLQQFRGPQGVSQLASLLQRRYGVTPEQKRHLAQLLSLVDRPEAQPTDVIRSLLGEADNAKVESLVLRGNASTPPSAAGKPAYYGDEGLNLFVSAPDAQLVIGPPPARGGRAARGRPILRATGRWRVVQLLDGGAGYEEEEVPEVYITPPRFGASAATVRVARMSNGSVAELRMDDPGSGYLEADGKTPQPPRIRIAPPGGWGRRPVGARAAGASLSPEYVLLGVELLDGGSGYNVDEPPSIVLREKLNVTTITAFTAAGASSSTGLPLSKAQQAAAAAAPASSIASSTVSERTLPLEGIAAVLKLPAPREGGMQVVQLGQLEAELRRASRSEGLELPVEQIRKRARKGESAPVLPTLPSALVPRREDAVAAPGLTPGPGGEQPLYRLPIAIPPGCFGVRSNAPVEDTPPLKPSQAARIFMAGAFCSSTAHTFLVPIDVVKTTLQQEGNDRYAGPVDCARGLVATEGPGSLLKGAGATAAGYALAGALSFGLVEAFGRLLRGAAGPGNALLYGSPLLALASVGATGLCATAICPFETVRVQSVRTGRPGLEVLREALAAEGVRGLFRGLPPILLKEVPFVVTKFVVFDFASEALASLATDAGLATTPVLATLLTIVAGALAGIAAILISQPADAVFTLTNEGPGVSVASAVDALRDEPARVADGLAPRLLFGVLLVSLQFFFFNFLKSELGVAKGDLTLVWDALAPLRDATRAASAL